MKAFRITGTFKMGLNSNQPFAKEMVAKDKNEVREKVYSDIGSRHNIRRLFINIKKIDEMTADQITDPLIKSLMTEKK